VLSFLPRIELRNVLDVEAGQERIQVKRRCEFVAYNIPLGQSIEVRRNAAPSQLNPIASRLDRIWAQFGP
jgi:hypothetical protein